MKTTATLALASTVLVGCASSQSQYYEAIQKTAEANAEASRARYEALATVAQGGDPGAATAAVMAIALTQDSQIQPQYIESTALSWAKVLANPIASVGMASIQAGVAKNASNNAALVQMSSYETNRDVQIGQQGMITGLGAQWSAASGVSSEAVAGLATAGFTALNTASTAGFTALNNTAELGFTAGTTLGTSGLDAVSTVSTAGLDTASSVATTGFTTASGVATTGFTTASELGTAGIAGLNSMSVDYNSTVSGLVTNANATSSGMVEELNTSINNFIDNPLTNTTTTTTNTTNNTTADNTLVCQDDGTGTIVCQ